MGKFWLIGGVGALAILLIVSAAVALLESEQSFEAGTPEAAVQSFLRSIEDEDFQIAYALLSTDLKARCSLDRLFGSSRYLYERYRNGRITHENTTTIESATVVTVRISTFRNSGPFGSSESSYERRYVLRQEEGQWLFVEYPWPPVQLRPRQTRASHAHASYACSGRTYSHPHSTGKITMLDERL